MSAKGCLHRAKELDPLALIQMVVTNAYAQTDLKNMEILVAKVSKAYILNFKIFALILETGGQQILTVLQSYKISNKSTLQFYSVDKF